MTKVSCLTFSNIEKKEKGDRLRSPQFDGHQDKGNIPKEVFDATAKKDSCFMASKTIRQITGKRLQETKSKIHHGGAAMGKDVAVKR